MSEGAYSIAGLGSVCWPDVDVPSPFSTPRSGGRLSSVDGTSMGQRRLGYHAAVEKLHSMILAREGIWDLFKDHDTCSALGIVCASDQDAQVVQHVIAGSPADLRWVSLTRAQSQAPARMCPAAFSKAD